MSGYDEGPTDRRWEMKPARESRRARTRKRSWFYRFAEKLDDTIETHPVARLCGLCFAVFGGLVLIGTGIQIMWEYESRQADRVARAWETISRPVSGNTGKGDALTYLFAIGREPGSIDLSCERSGGSLQNGDCNTETVIENFKVDGRETEPWAQGWNISHTSFQSAKLSFFHFSEVVAEQTRFVRSVLQNTGFEGGNVSDIAFINSAVLSTDITASKGVTFTGNMLDRTFVLISAGPGGEGFHFQSSRNIASAKFPPTLVVILSRFSETVFAMPGISYCGPGDKQPTPEEWFLAMENHACHLSEDQARKAFPKVWREIKRFPGMDEFRTFLKAQSSG